MFVQFFRLIPWHFRNESWKYARKKEEKYCIFFFFLYHWWIHHNFNLSVNFTFCRPSLLFLNVVKPYFVLFFETKATFLTATAGEEYWVLVAKNFLICLHFSNSFQGPSAKYQHIPKSTKILEIKLSIIQNYPECTPHSIYASWWFLTNKCWLETKSRPELWSKEFK